MADGLKGMKVAILATDGVERIELEQPRGALYGAGATCPPSARRSSRNSPKPAFRARPGGMRRLPQGRAELRARDREDAADPRLRVAVLGTGIMGGAMARDLIRAGLRVDVWDRRPEATGRLTEAGATAYVGPDEAVAHADVVITVLPDAAAVTSVAIGQGMLAALRQGTIWAQMGTIGVRATQQLAASVADQR